MTNYKDLKLIATSSPHIRGSETTQGIMKDVIIAMLPALAYACFNFGLRALTLTAVSVAGCVFFEWLYRKVMKKPQSIQDLSSVVTGMLLAFVSPVQIPYWMILIGDCFAIIIVKQLFGGIGKNFVNPALAGRAFLFFSWTSTMTKWTIDGVTMATPLSLMKAGSDVAANGYDFMQMFTGIGMPGSLGEISTAALLIGGTWLLARKVINWRIPVAFIGTVAVLTFIFPMHDFDRLDWMLYNLLSGGLFLGAIFMATDYSSSPVTLNGQLIYGLGCGALTVLIRYFGGFPEGVSFAILIMNLCSWAIDKGTRGRQFGVSKEDLKAAKKAAKEAKA